MYGRIDSDPKFPVLLLALAAGAVFAFVAGFFIFRPTGSGGADASPRAASANRTPGVSETVAAAARGAIGLPAVQPTPTAGKPPTATAPTELAAGDAVVSPKPTSGRVTAASSAASPAPSPATAATSAVVPSATEVAVLRVVPTTPPLAAPPQSAPAVVQSAPLTAIPLPVEPPLLVEPRTPAALAVANIIDTQWALLAQYQFAALYATISPEGQARCPYTRFEPLAEQSAARLAGGYRITQLQVSIAADGLARATFTLVYADGSALTFTPDQPQVFVNLDGRWYDLGIDGGGC